MKILNVHPVRRSRVDELDSYIVNYSMNFRFYKRLASSSVYVKLLLRSQIYHLLALEQD
jgi:hypothetical protein